MPIAFTILPTLLIAGTAAAASPLAEEAVARGDLAWSQRGEGHHGSQPDPEPIRRAVKAYEEALAASPDNLEVRWKLLRALYFLGDYATSEREDKLAIFQRGRELSDESRQLLAERVGRLELRDEEPEVIAELLAGEPQAASVYFWSAVHWGLWGRHRGKIAAARQGVAKKIRDFAEVTIRLDERLENAGGHRILGRLHAEAPRLPFFTGWVDRDRAVSELQRAVELAPHDLLSRLYLAEALVEHHKKRRDEAVELLRDLVGQAPDPAFVVEDERTLADASALLSRLGD